MRRAVLAAIRGYQRYISPHKGFCCAYRKHTGRASCSALGYRVVQRYGILSGLVLIRRRMFLCGVAHHRYSQLAPMYAQGGFCDFSCDVPCDAGCIPSDGCHFPSTETLSSYVSCCDCGSCDWPRNKKRNSEREQYVYIPPLVKKNPPSVQVAGSQMPNPRFNTDRLRRPR